MQRSKIRKELLLGTIGLVASIGLASAQGLQERGSAGGSEHGMSSGSSTTSPRSQTQSDRQTNHGQAQKDEPKGAMSNKAASGRHERSTTGQGTSEKNEPIKGSTSEESKGNASSESKKTNSESKTEGMTKGRNSAEESKKNEKSTTGQASTDKSQRSTTGQNPSERNEGTKEGSQHGRPSSQQPAQTQTQEPETGKQNQTSGSASQSQQNATQQSGAAVQSQAGVSINTQQQANIQRSVISASNAPRVNNVDFAIRTNTVVPSHVHVVGISTFPVLVEAFPRYRDDSFFVVNDEIVIVDHSHRIVDVVPAGPRAHLGRASSTTTIDLSEPEIRQVQQVLIERGFYHGHVDGHFGPEMREALISFQRKQGFEASGSVDTRTVGALGLSGKIGANQSGMQQPSGQAGTTGQAPASQQNSSGQANPPSQNQSQQKPTGNDQTNPADHQQPNARDQQGENKPSGSAPQTTGQGNNAQPSSAQGNSNTPSQSSGSSQKENRSNR
jgi:peptidoglycan hydrolase-like protein with peptidoglycan-binding domain